MNDLSELAGLQRYPLARRGLVMTSLISGFTLATQRVDAQVIHTDTTGLDAGETQVPVKDGHLPAYFARPAKGTDFPVILVNEEIFGVHEHIKDLCRRLAKVGYLAVATEYYARIGDLSKMTDVPTIFKDVISKKPDAEYMTDLDSTADWAGDNKGDLGRLAVTGFCRGGRQTWLYAAHNPHLKAAAAWYGPIKGPDQPHPAADRRSTSSTRSNARCSASMAARTPVFRWPTCARPRPRRKPRARPWRSSSIRTPRMASTPTTGRATAQPTRSTAWNRMLAWFKTYGAAPAT